MRTTTLSLFASLLLAACGGTSMDTDGGATDAGHEVDASYCISDGTLVGDCHVYDCAVRAASAMYCGTVSTVSFNCTGLDTLPMDYQAMARAYFTSCAPKLPTFMDTDVDVGMGMTAHVTACQQLKCATEFDSQRLYMCMAGVLQAECAPVAMMTECAFPDPPGFVCH